MKKRIVTLLITLLMSVCLTACGQDKNLATYEKNMNDFTENIAAISDTMDGIDPESETATTDLLSCLDQMNDQFQILAVMEIPDKFSNIAELAPQAGSYMQEAVSLYHELYEGAEFDEEKASAAAENYSRAMKRVSYISALLQGEIPEGSEIVVTEEDTDFEPVTQPEE